MLMESVSAAIQILRHIEVTYLLLYVHAKRCSEPELKFYQWRY